MCRSARVVTVLIEQGGRFIAIEAKFTEHPKESSLKGIHALENFYGEGSQISAYIASKTANPYPLSDKVIAIPGSNIDKYFG